MAWMPTTRATSAGSVSATAWPRLATPPLLTRRSIAPRSETTDSTMCASCSASSTLAWYARAMPPAAAIAATVESAASWSRR
jgi:hypothetical protein